MLATPLWGGAGHGFKGSRVRAHGLKRHARDTHRVERSTTGRSLSANTLAKGSSPVHSTTSTGVSSPSFAACPAVAPAVQAIVITSPACSIMMTPDARSSGRGAVWCGVVLDSAADGGGVGVWGG